MSITQSSGGWNNIELKKKCIAFDSITKQPCKNNVVGKSGHCIEHFRKCSKLYHEYKETCSEAKTKGECLVESIDKLSLEEINNYLTEFRTSYLKHRNCYRQRVFFRDTCVHPDNRDEGHAYQIQAEEGMAQVCEKMLFSLSKRLGKLRQDIIDKQEALKQERRLQLQLEENIKQIERDISKSSGGGKGKKQIKKSKALDKQEEQSREEIRELDRMLSKFEKERKEADEKEEDTTNTVLEDKDLQGFNYFYIKLFVDPDVKFSDIEKLDKKALDELDLKNVQHLDKMMGEKNCKVVLLRIQQILMSINKKFLDTLFAQIKEDLQNRNLLKKLNEVQQQVLVESEMLGFLNDRKVKERIANNQFFTDYQHILLKYDPKNYNSLLVLDITQDCSDLMIYIEYLCEFMYSILEHIIILDKDDTAMFYKIKNSQDTVSVLYTIAKLTDSMKPEKRFI